ncbi:NADPH2:quinone reductase [Micromonospora sp. HB375]|uniref:zinc-binding dehydrogenase n=1 Tax=unclassified Micromonospora TaxID=2617518 RepID=UPI001AE92353|nr:MULTISPECIES: zinc-binding dehydrogenase [unclassified Micromonospora]MBP1786300.1 NADPH2:quinone reductase [Micromonospora sp. HB375]MDH6471945.1 NADPH2:quinone reductase [Micromonospora sp. H404/HB375]
MRAVWLREFGGPEVLVPGTAPDPAPGPGQVLVDVAHANITFVETMFRATGFGPFDAELPLIPGNGVGGTITELGPGVDPALAGRVVVTATGGTGGYAERVVVDRSAPVPVPPGLALDAAVALMADGRTALMLARAAGLRRGDRVLVEAAAGGVGSLLTQLAAASGATVVAAAGGPAKVAGLRAAGLDLAVDYRQPGWTGRVRDAVGAVDVVFDGVGGPLAREAFNLLDPGGRMLSFGLAGGAWADIPAEAATARGVTLLSPRPGPDELRALTEAALAEGAAGRLRPQIGQRFPLDRAADAHAAIEARQTVGKTLLDVR